MTHPFLRHASVLWMNSGSSLSTNLQRRARNLKRPTSSRTSTLASRTLTSGSLRWETAFMEVCKNSDEAMSSRSDGLLFARWKLFLPLRIMARIWPQLTTCWRNTSSWRLTFLPMRYASHYYKWLHIRVSCNAVNTQYLISVHYSSQNTHLGSWSTSWLQKELGVNPENTFIYPESQWDPLTSFLLPAGSSERSERPSRQSDGQQRIWHITGEGQAWCRQWPLHEDQEHGSRSPR